jgi:hypothetical protein
MAWGVKQFTIKKMTKDKTMEEIVEVKCNYLSILAMYHLQITPLTERACKDTLWSYLGDWSPREQISRI